MRKTLTIYKPIGKTPLETIVDFKKRNPIYAAEKISVAGRLDPMAEGLLLLLVGDENKKRRGYETLTKVYDFSVLFGIETDSYDVLGIPKIANQSIPIPFAQIKPYIKTLVTTFRQPFPPFSSKPINGVPLYKLSRENKLGEVILPEKDVTIYSFELNDSWSISSSELLHMVLQRIELVNGNFRQKEIEKRWKELLGKNRQAFQVFDFTLSCSSGTYIRGVAHQMGRDFDTKSLALSIRRTAIGNYTLK